MSYTIRKTNGTTLTILADGQIDTAVSSINLIGKNVSNFGAAQNTNFIRLLENFAFDTQPFSPIQGQTWYNTNPAVNRLSVFTGTAWRPLAVTLVANTTTSTVVGSGTPFVANQIGDFWYDTDNKQLRVISGTGTESLLVGPESVTGFGVTKLSSVSMLDSANVAHPVIQITLDDEVIGIMSNTTFQTGSDGIQLGYSQIRRGITFKDQSVALTGEVTKLDSTYTRTVTDSSIVANWTFTTGSLNFGTPTSSKINWYNGGLNLTSTSSVSITAGQSSITLDSQGLYPTTSTVNLGLASNVYNSVFARSISSGGINSYGVMDGSWHLSNGSAISSVVDGSANIGDSTHRIGTVYTKGLNSGPTPGMLGGQWELGTGVSLVPVADDDVVIGSLQKKLKTIYTNGITVGSSTSTIAMTGAMSVAGNLYPSAYGQFDIGSSAYRWNVAYAMKVDSINLSTTNATIGTASVGTANITTATANTLNIQTIVDSFATAITKFDTDITLAANSDGFIPTQKAVKTYVDVTKQYLLDLMASFQTTLQAQVAAIKPVIPGSVIYVATPTPPDGYLVCNGSSVSKITYPDLFAAIGYTWGGTGNMFNLPDLRGTFIRGIDNGRGLDAGRVFGTWQPDDIKAHTHFTCNTDRSGPTISDINNTYVARGTLNGKLGYLFAGTNRVPTLGKSGSTGGTDTHPSNVALLPVIKF